MVCSSRSTRATPAFLTVTEPPVTSAMVALKSGSWPTSTSTRAAGVLGDDGCQAAAVEAAGEALVVGQALGAAQRLGGDLGSLPGAHERAREDRVGTHAGAGQQGGDATHHGAAVVGQRPLGVGALPLRPRAGRAVAQEDELHGVPLAVAGRTALGAPAGLVRTRRPVGGVLDEPGLAVEGFLALGRRCVRRRCRRPACSAP